MDPVHERSNSADVGGEGLGALGLRAVSAIRALRAIKAARAAPTALNSGSRPVAGAINIDIVRRIGVHLLADARATVSSECRCGQSRGHGTAEYAERRRQDGDGDIPSAEAWWISSTRLVDPVRSKGPSAQKCSRQRDLAAWKSRGFFLTAIK